VQLLPYSYRLEILVTVTSEDLKTLLLTSDVSCQIFIVVKNISIIFVEKYRAFYTHAFSVALYSMVRCQALLLVNCVISPVYIITRDGFKAGL
jgi:hypothetical protein